MRLKARRNAKRRRDENYKFQITNYKQITNPKLQITKSSSRSIGLKPIRDYGLQDTGNLKQVFSYIEFFKSSKSSLNFGHCILEFVCNLEFVICNFLALVSD
jgi:hypothetical protein